MRHVRDNDQLRTGLAHHLHETHDIGMAAELGQQLGFPEKIFLLFLISTVYTRGKYVLKENE